MVHNFQRCQKSLCCYSFFLLHQQLCRHQFSVSTMVQFCVSLTLSVTKATDQLSQVGSPPYVSMSDMVRQSAIWNRSLWLFTCCEHPPSSPNPCALVWQLRGWWEEIKCVHSLSICHLPSSNTLAKILTWYPGLQCGLLSQWEGKSHRTPIFNKTLRIVISPIRLLFCPQCVWKIVARSCVCSWQSSLHHLLSCYFTSLLSWKYLG